VYVILNPASSGLLTKARASTKASQSQSQKESEQARRSKNISPNSSQLPDMPSMKKKFFILKHEMWGDVMVLTTTPSYIYSKGI
jgi:hypothetical protein